MKRFHAVCYNSVMSQFRQALMAAILLVASGCASLPGQADQAVSSAPQIAYAQVKAAPESFKGQPVTFGGKVLGARRLKEGTRIEVLQLPLTSSSQPITDLGKSQGRFVALQKQFLDPATIPAGTFVTITGEVAGSLTMPLDETEYTYPVLHVTNLRVWTEDEDDPPRIRPHIGPGPYWGPYWSPYWRPWPYYW
jgi:outer membrane lipoprotein